MRAIILAGGKGMRLRPYTTLIPKPLVPLGDKYSIIEIILIQLKKQGFDRVTLAVNHFAHLISAYFGDGSRFGIEIDYSFEDTELSTIGPLTLINDLPDQFLVMNGDVLCDLDFGKFMMDHKKSGAEITVSSYAREMKVDFGVLDVQAGQLTGFSEKPMLHYEVSMGVYCFNRTIVSDLTRGARFGFDDLMRQRIESNLPVRVQHFDGYWLDIGRPEDYEMAYENIDSFIDKFGIDQ
jgi:NDP-sugar pyrophosphorylase family protein